MIKTLDICIAKNKSKLFSFLHFIDVDVDVVVLTSALINHKDFISKCNSVNKLKLDYQIMVYLQ